ncbi:uncharacterized protein RAG0_00809 [Rhynchosporium agropyri]|uniref:Uncharacterized protein n=1 Tax=Rhynchosporium agropyri TaxID=914238 RepID=A0A1E1JU85_9HELO|nr:uncharacterized protein RAG0_00809 [Rhynchosporium agropyri]
MAYTQGFRATAEHTYRSVQVDLLEGHIHEFQAQVIAIPIPANNRVSVSFNAAQIRANESMKLSVAQRVYKAAGDSDGTGQRSQKVRQGASRSTAEREGTAKLTGSYNLAPGVKSIVHAYHPKLPENGSKEALDTYVKELVDSASSSLFPGLCVTWSYSESLQIEPSPQDDGSPGYTKIRYVSENRSQTPSTRKFKTLAKLDQGLEAEVEKEKILEELEEIHRTNLAEMRANANQDSNNKRDKKSGKPVDAENISAPATSKRAARASTATDKAATHESFEQPMPKLVRPETRILPPAPRAQAPVRKETKVPPPPSKGTGEIKKPFLKTPGTPPKANALAARSPPQEAVRPEFLMVDGVSDPDDQSNEEDPEEGTVDSDEESIPVLPPIREPNVIPNGLGRVEFEDGSTPDQELHRTRSKSAGKRSRVTDEDDEDDEVQEENLQPVGETKKPRRS